MPQSSIRSRLKDFIESKDKFNSELYSIEYVPRSGRNKHRQYEQFYKGNEFRLFAWLYDVAEYKNGVIYKKEMQGTYWDYTNEINT